MKKILFVAPVPQENKPNDTKEFALVPRNVLLLASLTPPQYEVEIWDELFGPVDTSAAADLVAITCMTPTARRAYDIAAQFRARGIPVIVGGIHPSMLPDEAARFADAVVIGEAEPIWTSILADWDGNGLQRRYHGHFADLGNVPRLRRELLRGEYSMDSIETSRGCANDCAFCSVTRFFGGRHRRRPIQSVLAEVESLSSKVIYVTDDNIIGPRGFSTEQASQLFDGLRGMGKNLIAAACVTISEEPRLLKQAADAGIRVLFIGFESIDVSALTTMNKRPNLKHKAENFTDAVRAIRDHGIAVCGGFIFGSDEDHPDVFSRTADFVMESGMDTAQFNLLVPMPATRLYAQLEAEGRLQRTTYPHDWEFYNGFEVVYQPKNISAEQLLRGQLQAYEAIAPLSRSLRRAVGTLWSTRSLVSSLLTFSFTRGSHQSIRRAEEWRSRRRELEGANSAPASPIS